MDIYDKEPSLAEGGLSHRVRARARRRNGRGGSAGVPKSKAAPPGRAGRDISLLSLPLPLCPIFSPLSPLGKEPENNPARPARPRISWAFVLGRTRPEPGPNPARISTARVPTGPHHQRAAPPGRDASRPGQVHCVARSRRRPAPCGRPARPPGSCSGAPCRRLRCQDRG